MVRETLGDGSRGSGRRRDAEVLDAATRAFHARGYAGARVKRIAGELGILSGSLYHYIGSKEDLLARVLDVARDESQAILADVAALEGLGPLERLREYARRQAEHSIRSPAHVAIFSRDAGRLPPHRRCELDRARHDHQRFVAGLVREAQRRGEAAPDLDARVVTNCVFGSALWVHRWSRAGADVGPAELAEMCADFVLRGVVGDRTPAP